ncbi:MAG: universal stress protein, partial [Halobacteriaceae archaeon]
DHSENTPPHSSSLSEHRAAITDYVEAEGVDLVVMGTRGRSGLRRTLLGSVTERVVRTASVPVVTVPASAEAAEAEP